MVRSGKESSDFGTRIRVLTEENEVGQAKTTNDRAKVTEPVKFGTKSDYRAVWSAFRQNGWRCQSSSAGLCADKFWRERLRQMGQTVGQNCLVRLLKSCAVRGVAVMKNSRKDFVLARGSGYSFASGKHARGNGFGRFSSALRKETASLIIIYRAKALRNILGRKRKEIVREKKKKTREKLISTEDHWSLNVLRR